MAHKELSEKTKLEMVIGRRRALANAIWDVANDGEGLQSFFPNLCVFVTIPHPYDLVRVEVREHGSGPLILEMEEPIDGFPSNMLLTKLALIS